MKNTNERQLRSKKEHLINQLSQAGSLLVAYSGGVDSSFLLAMAREVLGNKVVAATAVSEIYPARDLEEARVFNKPFNRPGFLLHQAGDVVVKG